MVKLFNQTIKHNAKKHKSKKKHKQHKTTCKKGGVNSRALQLVEHSNKKENDMHKVSHIWQYERNYGISISATKNSGGGYYLHNKSKKDFNNHVHLFLDGTWNKKSSKQDEFTERRLMHLQSITPLQMADEIWNKSGYKTEKNKKTIKHKNTITNYNKENNIPNIMNKTQRKNNNRKHTQKSLTEHIIVNIR